MDGAKRVNKDQETLKRMLMTAKCETYEDFEEADKETLMKLCKHQARSLSRRLHNSYRHAARLGRQLNVLRGTVVNLRQQLNDRNAAIVAKDQSISTANKNYSVLKALKDNYEKKLSTSKFTVDELHRNFKVQASTLATEKKHHQAQIASNQKLELVNKKLVDESAVVKAFLQRHNYPWEDVLACSKKEQDFTKSVCNEQSS